MKVFVIIVSYNPKKWIDKCLESLEQSSCFVQTIIVDNNSTDGSKDYIRQNFSQVILIENKENLGFGAANNIGIKKAFKEKADYVFLLNQDAWIQSNTIEKLIEAHQKNPEYGIISPMHLNGGGDALDYNFSNFINPLNCKNLYSDIFLNKSLNQIYKVKYVNAAAWLISRNCIENVGGFNPSFFHYGEDNNYVQRAKFHKFDIGVLTGSVIYHDRENRKKSDFFTEEIKIYKRSIVLKMSNPYCKYSFKKEYFKLWKEILKLLIFFKINRLNFSFKKLQFLNKLDKKQIFKNRMKSTIQQPSFIND